MVGCLADNSAVPQALKTGFAFLSQRRVMSVLRLFAVDSKKVWNRKILHPVKTYRNLNFFTPRPQDGGEGCEQNRFSGIATEMKMKRVWGLQKFARKNPPS
jgi:hypothetical protein